MKALIIGGAGFVGEYLARHLLDCGYEVWVTKLPNEAIQNAWVRVIDLDILDATAIDKLLRRVAFDHIYHLAAQSSVALSWENPALTVDVNVKGAVNLLKTVQEIGQRPRLLLVGSGEEYGYIREGECPIEEENALRPGNIYAATKVCQNMLGAIYAKAFDMEVMMVRAFNHIGPYQLPRFVVADFCKQVAEIEAGKREPVIRVGNLSVKRDFTDVRDVVRAYELIMKNGEKGQTYNVGSGHAIEIGEMLDRILAFASCTVRVEKDPKKFRPADVPIIEADISRLSTLTGWESRISLDQTLSECLDYWRSKQ